jgi:hypothetical protein
MAGRWSRWLTIHWSRRAANRRTPVSLSPGRPQLSSGVRPTEFGVKRSRCGTGRRATPASVLPGIEGTPL